MHDFTHFTDRFFIHAVGRRIGHHDTGEVIARLFRFRAQISQIDVAVFITRHNHHLHSCHMRGSRVSAVRRSRDQADIAMPFVAAFMIMTNRQQARVFALCARVRLHTNGVVTGQFHQPVSQLRDHLLITFSLFRRAERVQFGKFRPGDRDHLGGGVQFHGAGTQRDHRLIQRQIFTLQRVHIAHHFGFAVVAIKHRMGEDFVVAQHRSLNRATVVSHVFVQCVDVQPVVIAQQHAEKLHHVFARSGFIKGDPNRVQNIATQVDFSRFGTRQHARFVGHFHTQSIEIVRMAQLQTFLLQARRQDIGQTVDAVSDTFQANRAVINGIQAGDVCQQYLGSTNVGVRFLTTNMLLASLHRHAQSGVASCIFRYTDNTARH